MMKDIYAELKLVQDNFYLEDGKVYRTKTKEEVTSKTARVKDLRLFTMRIQWQLENRQPVPEGGSVRELNGKLVCYHQISLRCSCGHFVAIKDYITEECCCAKCYSVLTVPTALPGDDCPHCNGFLVPRNSGAGMFLGCSNVASINACRHTCFLDKRHALFVSPEEL